MRFFIHGVLLLTALSSQAFALDLRGLINHARGLTNQTPYVTPVPDISDQEITDLLNEGQDFASAYSWAFVNRTTFTLIVGATEYLVPSDFQVAKRVVLDNTLVPEVTLDALDSERDGWAKSGGKPSNYYIRSDTFTYIGFYPWPNSRTSTGAVTFDYYARVSPLEIDSDVPWNGLTEFYPLHQILSVFVAYRYYLRIGNLSLADIYAKEFAAGVKRLTEISETKKNYRPGAIGYER